jgi:putative serine/threonine protein kinase
LTESREVPVRKLVGTNYSRILTYPVSNDAEAKARTEELAHAGVVSLHFDGHTMVGGIPVLGKGCVGIVTRAIFDGVPVALKIRRTDADRSTMVDEGRLLRLANSVGVGPRLITATKNFLVMEFFDGIPLFRWAGELSPGDGVRVKRVLGQLLRSCFSLDAMGLDHGELSHAPKNVLVSRPNEPCIVDFESASTTRRVANVTSLLQYFLFGKITRGVRRAVRFPNRRTVVRSLSQYKAQGSVESFQELLGLLGLSR